MGIAVRLEGFNATKTMNRIINNDRVGLYMAETTAKHMNKYVPYKSSVLSTTYITKPWNIEFMQPYARRQFYGNNFNFTKDFHPLAQAHWDIPTQKNQGKKIAKEMTELIK